MARDSADKKENGDGGKSAGGKSGNGNGASNHASSDNAINASDNATNASSDNVRKAEGVSHASDNSPSAPRVNGAIGISSNGANNASKSGANASEIVRLSSRLERAVDAVDHVLASGKNVTLDFSDCEFVTVDGLEWLEEILLRSESLKSTVTFIKLKPKLYKVFKVAHIDSLQKACGAPGPAMGPVC